MIETFQIGETVVLTYTCTKDGSAYDPATSVKIAIYTEAGATDTASADMTNDSTGSYSYNYQTAGKVLGRYKARVTSTDGTLITITDEWFTLEG
jgi:hypothetical protein